MPRNRNGRKKQIDDLTEDHGLLGGADKDLEYLLSIFSDVDAEITHAVYIECKKDVHQAMETMIEMCGGSSEAKTVPADQNDLATIACSLLDQEKASPNKSEIAVGQSSRPLITEGGAHYPTKFNSQKSCLNLESSSHSLDYLVHQNSNVKNAKKEVKGERKNLNPSVVVSQMEGFVPNSQSVLEHAALAQKVSIEKSFGDQLEKNAFPGREQSFFSLPQPEPIISAEWEQFYSSMNAGSDNVHSDHPHHIPSIRADKEVNSKCSVSSDMSEQAGNIFNVSYADKENSMWSVQNEISLKSSMASRYYGLNTYQSISKCQDAKVQSLDMKNDLAEHVISVSSNSNKKFDKDGNNDIVENQTQSSSSPPASPPAFVPRSVAHRTPMKSVKKNPQEVNSLNEVPNSSSLQEGLKPLKPLAAFSPRPRRTKKQSNGPRKPCSTDTLSRNALFSGGESSMLPLARDQSDSSDSSSLDSRNSYLNQERVSSQYPRDPRDPLGFHTLWVDSSEWFEDPKPQRDSKKGKSNITSLPQETSKQSKPKTTAMPTRRAPPPWAPAKGDLHTRSANLRSLSHLKDGCAIDSYKVSAGGNQQVDSSSDDMSVKNLQKINMPGSSSSEAGRSNVEGLSSSSSEISPPQTSWQTGTVKISNNPSQTSSSISHPKVTKKVSPAAQPQSDPAYMTHTSHSSPKHKSGEKTGSQLQQHTPGISSPKTDFARNRLVLRGVKSPVGVIRRYILEKQPVFVILRGLPGSGKSYLAKLLLSEAQGMGVSGIILSTDEFFTHGGNYVFNRNDLGEAHEWNKKRALQCAKQSVSPIIIDNTNTTMWELLPYAVLALEYRYDVQMFEPDTPWRYKLGELVKRNTHSVAKESIKRMKERYESLTLDQVMKEACRVLSKRKSTTAHLESAEPIPAVITEDAQPVKPPKSLSSSDGGAAGRSPALNLSDWFDNTNEEMASASPLPQRQKTADGAKTPSPHAGLQESSREITPAFLRQSLKTAILNSMKVGGLELPVSKETESRGGQEQGEAIPEGSHASVNQVTIQSQAAQIDAPKPLEEDSVLMISCSMACDSKVEELETNVESPAFPTLESQREIIAENNLCDFYRDDFKLVALQPEQGTTNRDLVLTTHNTTEEFETRIAGAVVSNSEDLADKAKSERSMSGASDLSHRPSSASTSESFRSCVSDLDAVSVTKSDNPDEQEISGANDSVTTDPLPQLSLSGFFHTGLRSSPANLDNAGEGDGICSENNKDEVKGESFQPETPATIVGDEQPPFQSLADDFLASGFSLYPRASSPKRGLTGEDFLKDRAIDSSDAEPATVKELSVSDIFVDYGSAGFSDKFISATGNVCSLEGSSVDPPTIEAAQIFAENPTQSSPCLLDQTNEILEEPLPNAVSSRVKHSSCEKTGPHPEGSTKSVQGQSSLPSLVAYSDSDSDHGAPVAEEDVSSANLDCLKKEEKNSVHTKTEKHPSTNVPEGNVQDIESSRDHSPETPPSCGVSSSEKEGSPCPLKALPHDVLPKRKKRVRIRKGRGHGPFLEESLKEKSKSENWSSFFTPPPGSAKLDEILLENKPKNNETETKSSLCQCDPYMFSMVHKLNSPSFNTLQPVDFAAICEDDDVHGLRILRSSSLSNSLLTSKRDKDISNQASESKDQPERESSSIGTSFVPRKSETTDRSTSTEDASDQGQVDLETLQSCFPEYSRQQLEQVMTICHNDLEWVTSHLLDSPALIDQEEEDVAEVEETTHNSGEAGLNFPMGQEKEGLHFGKSPVKSAMSPKSLAEMSREVVRESGPVDSDDLEMQIIQAGQTRLQKIERHHWTRCQSLSTRQVWSDDLRLEDFTGTVEPDEFWEWQPSPKFPEWKTATPFSSPSPSQHQPFLGPRHTKPPSPQYGGGNFLSSLMAERKFSGPLAWQTSDDGTDTSQQFDAEPSPYQDKRNVSDSVSEKPDLETIRPVVPQELISCLEKMFGPLGIASGHQGLALEDHIAHKVYNCLKLQLTSKKMVSTPSRFNSQVQTDEALARALQEEEDIKGGTGSSAELSGQIPGWTSSSPSWMQQSSSPTTSISQRQSQSFAGGETKNMANSVSEALNRLRGSSGMKKLTPFKFRRHQFENRAAPAASRNKALFGLGSVWDGKASRAMGHADSLHSIMAEQRAIEKRQHEQLQALEVTDDNQALSTKIKRSQLGELFPTVSPDFLEEVFVQTGYSLEKTAAVLQSTYHISPTPLAQEMEEAMVKKAEAISRREYAHHQPEIPGQGDEIFWCEEDPSSVTYQDLRAEAQFYRGLARECQEQASRHNREGMHGAALFYRQRVKKYKEEEYEANHRAAAFLFDKGSERLDKENTLDLHFYHLDEAVAAVNKAVAMKEENLRLNPGKRNSYLNIVTGRGRNSKGGIPRLKPAIINHLRDRCLPYEEKHAGMLRVQIGQRL